MERRCVDVMAGQKEKVVGAFNIVPRIYRMN